MGFPAKHFEPPLAVLVDHFRDEDNAEAMLALAALDHSRLWTDYWKLQRAASGTANILMSHTTPAGTRMILQLCQRGCIVFS